MTTNPPLNNVTTTTKHIILLMVFTPQVTENISMFNFSPADNDTIMSSLGHVAWDYVTQIF